MMKFDLENNNDRKLQDLDDSELEIDFKAIVFILRKRFKLILLLTFLIGFVALFYSYTIIPIYKSTVTIALEIPGRAQNIFNMGDQFGSNMINNEIQKLESVSLAEDVVKNLIANPNMHPSYLFNTKQYAPVGLRGDINSLNIFNKDIGTSSEYNTFEEFPRRYFEDVTKKLKTNIEVKKIKQSDMIAIDVYSNDSKEVSIIANAFANTYQIRDLAWGSGEINNLRNFLEVQLDIVESDLNIMEDSLRIFKEDEGIFELEGNAKIVLEELAEVESKYNNTLAEISVMKEQKTFIYSKLSQEEKTLANELLNSIDNRLSALRLEIVQNEADLVKNMSLYGPNHEAVRSIQTKINQLKQSLSQQTDELIAQGVSTADPIKYRQTLMDRVLEIESEEATLQSQAKQYKLLVDQYSGRLGTLPAKSMEFARLERDRSVLAQTYSIMRQKLEEAKISEASEVGKVRIIDYARPPRNWIKPNTKVNLLLGIISGFILSLLIIMIRELLDVSIKSIHDIEKQAIPVLGTIHKFEEVTSVRQFNKNRRKNIITIEFPDSPISESYRSIRTNILYSHSQNNKSILITSPGSSEGKSSTVSNLAVLYAKTGKKTLLLDADLRKPVQHRIFKVNQEPGLVHHLLDMNIDLSDLIQPTYIGNLSVLASGTIPPNPAELLGTEKMINLLAQLKEKWDVILIDTPPILVVTDASLLAKAVDNLILVIKSGVTHKEALIRSQKIIGNLNTAFSGTILNGVSDRHSYYSNYYYSEYYHKDNSESSNILKIILKKFIINVHYNLLI